jgi:hypothetical protein
VFLTQDPGFQELVKEEWDRPLSVTNPYLRLHIKLWRTIVKLRKWARYKLGNNKLLMTTTKQLIWILDVVAEYRQLTQIEISFKRDLKARYLGMSVVGKAEIKATVQTQHDQGNISF